MQSFNDLGASRPVVRALGDRGVVSPFEVQRLVIPDVLAGRDVLVKSPTGSGKTLAFGVPMVDRLEATDRRAAALVLAPTRELATQIVDDLHDLAASRALSIAAVYGGAGIERQIKRARGAHVVVATPGRLEDLLERRAITLEHVRILVLDEADRMLDMGFRPAVDRIVARTPKSRQTLFFSATLDGDVRRLARAYTRDPRSHEHATKRERRGDVEHRFVHVRHDEKLDALVRELSHPDRGLTLIFVRTKRGADRLVQRLKGREVAALAMHGDKSQSQRERALARFESGQVDTLVATDVAARGLDVDGITHVINFDAPGDRDGYVHRVGRTGRAGRTGTGVTLVSADQAGDVQKIADDLSLHADLADPAVSARPASRPGRSSNRRHRRTVASARPKGSRRV